MRAKTLLAELDVAPRKSRGQNFLLDPHIADNIVQFARLEPGEAVLEIGPGLGTLTNSIMNKAPNLAVVEIEEKFCNYLRAELFTENPARVHCADIRSFDPRCVLESLAAKHLTVMSNVPYSISSEIILWLLRHRRCMRTACLLLQEEFADRIAARPGERQCGSLTIMRALYADVERGPRVPGSAFHPRAAVGSRVLRFVFRESQFDIDDEAFFEKVVRAAFAQRRKTLVNSLWSARLRESKAEIEQDLRAAGIDPGRRAETLSLAEFASAVNQLAKNRSGGETQR